MTALLTKTTLISLLALLLGVALVGLGGMEFSSLTAVGGLLAGPYYLAISFFSEGHVHSVQWGYMALGAFSQVLFYCFVVCGIILARKIWQSENDGMENRKR